jgi:hypothetical protein
LKIDTEYVGCAVGRFTTVCSASGEGGGVMSGMVVENTILIRKQENVMAYHSRNKHKATALEH